MNIVYNRTSYEVLLLAIRSALVFVLCVIFLLSGERVCDSLAPERFSLGSPCCPACRTDLLLCLPPYRSQPERFVTLNTVRNGMVRHEARHFWRCTVPRRTGPSGAYCHNENTAKTLRRIMIGLT